MSIDFPCSVHKDTYENSRIAVDANEYKELAKDGWVTSEEFLNPESAPKKRGPKPKAEEE
jgi:hypothetical protein